MSRQRGDEVVVNIEGVKFHDHGEQREVRGSTFAYGCSLRIMYRSKQRSLRSLSSGRNLILPDKPKLGAWSSSPDRTFPTLRICHGTSRRYQVI